MRTFTTAWKHIRRSPYQAAAAILTMFLTFLLTGTFFLTTGTSILILRFFESKPQITVFFQDVAGSKEAEALEATLQETGKIASVKYVSKEDALVLYKEQNKSDPSLLEMVTADILPASLEVSTTDPSFLKDIEPLLTGAPGVEEVVYQKDVVESLLSWTNAIRLAGGVLAVLLVIDALLITMTVISMKIALKREEIEILKLVGASKWYIQLPFIFEGGWYGALGGGIAASIVVGLIVWFRPSIDGFLGIIPMIHAVLANPESLSFLLFSGGFWVILTTSGFLLGSIGSMIALVRYLRF